MMEYLTTYWMGIIEQTVIQHIGQPKMYHTKVKEKFERAAVYRRQTFLVSL